LFDAISVSFEKCLKSGSAHNLEYHFNHIIIAQLTQL